MEGRREVVLVGFEGLSILDVAGPAEVFDGATRAGAQYRVQLATLGGGAVRSMAGIRLEAQADLREVGPVDTIVVLGGAGYTEAAADHDLLEEIRRIAARSRRVTSVCTGAMVLAAAGLLDGRRATTHWSQCDVLAATHPAVQVVPDAIFVHDGKVATSAGVTAGIDLALALVERDHGAELARTVAKRLVVFMQRPGGQSQFSVRADLPPVRDASLKALLDAIAADPASTWTVPTMARFAGLSERHLARTFVRLTGVTPAQHVERTRIEAATVLLQTGHESLDSVARRSGFGTDETLRRAFLRVVGVSPGAYRDRFRTTGTQEETA